MEYISLLWNFFRLRSNAKKSKEKIKNIQEQKLRNLLEYAYEHSEYYHRSFKKAGITLEQISALPLSAFPTIDKALLMEHFNELVTESDITQEELRYFDEEETECKKIFKDKYHIVHSSGSTGKPGYFVYDEKAWAQMLLSIIRSALWDMTTLKILKLLISKPRILYIGATDGRYGGAMAVGDGIDKMNMKQLFVDIKTPLAKWIKAIDNFKPNIIIGYPSAIKILGELVEKGEIEVNIIRVISCGEPLGTNLRNYFEKTFHSIVVNIYGASESLALGVEIGGDDGLYLFDDMNYIEVEDGNMYLTSLYNYVQPLIRYRISDQLVLKKAVERSRYQFTMAENILGRDEDLLWFEDENGVRDFLHPLAIEGFCIAGLIDYQFRQISNSRFEMIAEVHDENRHPAIIDEMQRNMQRILKEKDLAYVQFDVSFTNKIYPDPKTGKKRLIVVSQG